MQQRRIGRHCNRPTPSEPRSALWISVSVATWASMKDSAAPTRRPPAGWTVASPHRRDTHMRLPDWSCTRSRRFSLRLAASRAPIKLNPSRWTKSRRGGSNKQSAQSVACAARCPASKAVRR